MENVEFQTGSGGKGQFFIEEDGERIARMFVRTEGAVLTAIHTEVEPKGEGRGLAKQLLAAMVQYVRDNSLKVIADCPFVHAQFKRHPELYADIWQT